MVFEMIIANMAFGYSGGYTGYTAAIHPEYHAPMSVMRFGGTPETGPTDQTSSTQPPPIGFFGKKLWSTD
jgi:hypothetical protein